MNDYEKRDCKPNYHWALILYILHYIVELVKCIRCSKIDVDYFY